MAPRENFTLWRPLCCFLLFLIVFYILNTYDLQRQKGIQILKLLHLTPYNPLLPTNYADGPWQPKSFNRTMFKFLEKKFGGKRNGFFIECGASDGAFLSNTLDLERDYNWTGLLIEPDPLAFPSLKARNRRAWITDVCLSPKPVPVKLNSSGIPDGLSNTKKMYREEDKKSMSRYSRRLQVECYPLAMFLDAIGVTHVDFFGLDVERMEVDILKTIPWDRLDIKLISVEVLDAKVKNDTFKFMTSIGYERIKEFNVDADYLLDDVYERQETEKAQELRRNRSVELRRSSQSE